MRLRFRSTTWVGVLAFAAVLASAEFSARAHAQYPVATYGRLPGYYGQMYRAAPGYPGYSYARPPSYPGQTFQYPPTVLTNGYYGTGYYSDSLPPPKALYWSSWYVPSLYAVPANPYSGTGSIGSNR